LVEGCSMRRVLLVAMVMICSFAHGQAVQGTFESAGLTLHYTAVGSGSPVVILSGGPGMDVDYMRPVAEMVAATHHTAILLEQRGTGRSMPAVLDAKTVSGELMLADVEALRVKLGVTQVMLLGHSAGAITALSYAIAHPAAVKALVLMGVPGPEFKENSKADAVLMERLTAEDKALMGEASAHPEKFMDVLRVLFAADFSDRAKGRAFAATQTAQNFHVTTMTLIESSGAYDLRAGLSTLHMPVLIVQGKDDPYSPEIAAETKDSVAGAQMVAVDGAGHFGWLEQPGAYETALSGFLASK
jgi:proline iminopeptidase